MTNHRLVDRIRCDGRTAGPDRLSDEGLELIVKAQRVWFRLAHRVSLPRPKRPVPLLDRPRATSALAVHERVARRCGGSYAPTVPASVADSAAIAV